MEKVIFVVESDQQLLRSYADALVVCGQVVTFRTASLAVKALDKCIPDVMVLDLALPGHNGFELLYELRSYADTRGVRVIINSLMREQDIDWSFVSQADFGIVKYLHKSDASLDQLIGAVKEAMDASQKN